jgi:tetratricopeptide (TPR) repeat protein
MRPRNRRRLALACCALFALGCSQGQSTPAPGSLPTPETFTPKDLAEERKPHKDLLRDEIPPGQLDTVMTAHFEGLGLMEQYEYDKAIERFRDVHERAPGWIAGSINLANALLNQAGKQTEESKQSSRGAPAGVGAGTSPNAHYDEALALLDAVIDRDPKNPHAHFCRGLIRQQFPDKIAAAHDDFRLVTELDPNDAQAWYRSGMTLDVKETKERIKCFSRALECNPYLAPALYNLSFAYRLDGRPEKQKELLAAWNKLKIDQPDSSPAPGPADSADTVYGEMGRYASVINPFPQPRPDADPAVAPRFEPAAPIRVKLPEGHRWARDEDFKGPLEVLKRARARFGAAVATFDGDGDGKADLYLAAAVVGPDGVRDALLRNLGEGRFEDVTLDLGLPKDRASLGVAAADFDADRRVDLFLTGLGDNRLFHNTSPKGFEDVTKALKPTGPSAVALTARWLDLDQDGDLDLYVVNYTAADHAGEAFTDKTPPGIPNTVYRNDGRPEPVAGVPAPAQAPVAVAWPDMKVKGGLSIALTPWAGDSPLLGGESPHTGLAALDIDNDRDIDLVLASEGAPATALLNDRLGRFRAVPLESLSSSESGPSLLVTDFDKDARADLVAVGPKSGVHAFRNTTDRAAGGKDAVAFEPWPIDARDWRSAQAADLDLDGWPDLVGLPAGNDAPAPAWARNEGKRFATRSLGLGLEPPGLVGQTLADLVGDPLPDLLVVKPGEAPRLAKNLGNGHHWLALELGGHWRPKPELMRTNPHALGTKLLIEGQGLHVTFDHTTPDAGLAQSVGPVVLGLGKVASPTLVHARWPDGVLQCELGAKADQKQTLAENNRKTGSCPVLFTWNGERFVCLGDFLGGGGLGYLVAPGVHGRPDRDEAVAIAPDQLRAEGGVYRLSVTEPMDEVAYLDRLTLEVVDRPPGVSATPDERFVPEGPRPTGNLVAWRETVAPVRATDLGGHDVTERLRAWDRATVDRFAKLRGWVGYAEEHGIVLDFGDRLSRFGPGDRLILCLAGWVEYPYSQTNYAAATAGVALRPPAVERRRADGLWEVIEPHAGYPAGLPRMTTLDLTGKLTGPGCVIRLRTNMECYWDQAFVAVALRDPGLKVTALPVARAVLGDRGYTREVSPDGRLPLVYDYDYVDPAPLARLSGRLTRFGDVADLLRSDDDRLCLVGPGDEVRLEFDARRAPALPAGWTRSYVLRAVGYCKDADPFTAASDTVGPLPWRGMPDEYPFGPAGERPRDDAYRAYLSEYQTRHSEAH